MLTVRGLHAGYGTAGAAAVLRGIDFDLRPGEIVALLGRNGAGRSTLLRALMGLLPWRGRVEWNGRSLLGLAPHRVARLGIGYVPESRDVFPDMSVRNNLLLGEQAGRAAWSLDAAFDLFPALGDRADVPAGVLSGGEQQMLALCRTLMARPDLLLVDEPTEGLAPALSARVATCLQGLRKEGRAVLLVEQKLAFALDIADRVLLLGHGRCVFDGTPADLQAQPALLETWLQVADSTVPARPAP